MMDTQERNRRIYEIRKSHPEWSYQEIGALVNLSRQRVWEIVRHVEAHGIIDTEMEPRNNHRLDGKPISATQVAKETGIPYGTISKWVSEGEVKVVERRGHTGPGIVVLLDPQSLEQRINRYRPRPRRNRVPA